MFHEKEWEGLASDELGMSKVMKKTVQRRGPNVCSRVYFRTYIKRLKNQGVHLLQNGCLITIFVTQNTTKQFAFMHIILDPRTMKR